MFNHSSKSITPKMLFTFVSFTLFYFFEFAQMSYFNALAPSLLNLDLFNHHQIGALSAAYYYGNVVGLLPAGFLLDHFPLRKIFLVAILGSVLGALLLATSHTYSLALIARFACGFFGGTFSFVGGIRLLVNLFSNRFTLFMGIFLTSGMLGGLVCQYPLLLISNNFGPYSAILTMFFVGALVLVFNIFFLHPNNVLHEQNKSSTNYLQSILRILKNYRNWCDCFLIIFLDSPFTILGTLWGVLTLSNLYHFSSGISAFIMTLMFAGSIVGSLLFGIIADRYNNHVKLVLVSTVGMFLLILLTIFITMPSPTLITVIFFLIGFLTGSQTIVFTWLTKNMQPELVGRNSAMNSMLFMGAGGVFKQVCAGLLILPSFILARSTSVNLLVFMGVMMLIATIYISLRQRLFTSNKK